ncbi:MAG: hypothetical protein M1818_004580 [Claussenomyces sp. TS43310]|nr:MAG: hypothetical protein M1818_004580 [Claussenomyces sp. TS43310]
MFPFVYVCDLLERLQTIIFRDPPYLQKDIENKTCETITSWIRFHRRRIDQASGDAFLSTLLPERRTDRVYHLKEKTLEKILARALALPNSRLSDLKRWRDPGAGDLADCLERVQKQAEMVTQAQANTVSIEEIDKTLIAIASHCRFSSLAIQALASNFIDHDTHELLASLYLRLQARESKWLTRLILKNYAPIIIPERTVLHSYHPLLPDLLKIQAEFSAALQLLQQLPRHASAPGSNLPDGIDILRDIEPVVATKIGRQTFFKSRSIKQCVDMARNRRMSVETKYDGEYCQIHVDMSKPKSKQIKIFSKSGKDSTRDRINAHGVIRECLGLDNEVCVITSRCILEGELLVYSDKHHKILDFHKIRKHVNRSGSFLGTELDSPAHDYEHLMIVFFDMMVLDKVSLLSLKYSERIQVLERVIQCIPGRAALVQRTSISFSKVTAAADLRRIFARCITSHGEGLILKPLDDPYFDFSKTFSFRSCCIKLKKEYITGFGDVGDFTVVGAAYDAVTAKTYGIAGLKWTHFYLGALENKLEVTRYRSKPNFVVVTTIKLRKDILLSFLRYCNPCPVAYEANDVFDLCIANGINQGRLPSTIFTKPPVFDMRCFSFVKEPNVGFWTLRFPEVTKVHFDRTYQDTTSFEELQEMAEKSSVLTADVNSQEDMEWILRLQTADPRGQAVDAVSPSTQRTSTFMAAPTPELSPVQTRFLKAGSSLHTPTSKTSTKRGVEEESNGRVSQSKRHKQSSPPEGIFNKRGPLGIPLSDITSNARSKQSSLQANSCALVSAPKIRSLSFAIAETTLDHPQFRRSTQSKYRAASFPTNSIRPDHKSQTVLPATFPMTTSPEASLCQLSEGECIFSHFTFCLSPCISNMPYIYENLLSPHGRSHVTNPSAWLDPTGFPSHCPRTGLRIRKILLVESRREVQTRQAIDMVEKLGSSRDGDTKELVEVYDWRLLEDVAKMERGKALEHNVWRKHYVGIVYM